MKMWIRLLFFLPAAAAMAQTPGQTPGGRILLHDGWKLSPIGKAVDVGTLPLTIVPLPGNRAAVLLCGYSEQGIDIVNFGDGSRQRLVIAKTFVGLAASADGKTLYASGGADNVVHVFQEAGTIWREENAIRIAPAEAKAFIAGIALDEAHRKLYACENLADRLAVVDLDSGSLVAEFPTKSDPYQVRVTADGARAFVSNWGDSSVSDIALDSSRPTRRIETGSHPVDLLLDERQKRLYAACAQSDVVSVVDTATDKTILNVSTTLTPGDQEGATPASLAFSADGTRLFVANSDNNDVAVLARSDDGLSVTGFLPTGRYPTAVAVAADGSLLVADGKGSRTFANPAGPQPGKRGTDNHRHYILTLQTGDVRAIPTDALAHLDKYSRDVVNNRPAPPKIRLSPAFHQIQHVIYVIKENRTYDQVLGDDPRGNGDPSLVLFGKTISPNHHALANEFTLLDNFYCNAEVSADGHNWSTAAFANDYVEKTYPSNYSDRGRRYDFEGARAIAYPRAGFLWDEARRAGLSYRSYGEFVNLERTGRPETTRVPALRGHIDPAYHGWDLDYSDLDREAEWEREFRQFEKSGNLPALEIVRLPNDHTHGTTPGALTPLSYMAQNDAALGKLVDTVTLSRYFRDTAIFIVEDDAQNGPDHVDCHRSLAFVISPYTPRHAVDHRMYSTASVLKTIEEILRLPAMSQYDNAATPMAFEFSEHLNLAPFTALAETEPLNRRNRRDAPLSRAAEKSDFSQEDRVPETLFNDMLYEAIQHRPAPAPTVHFAVRRPPGNDSD